MEAFCREHGVAYEICGKVIVAVDEAELPALDRLVERGEQNGVRCEVIERDRLHELEPYAAGIRAIHVPETGIVNFREVCDRLATLVRQRGGEVVCGAKVEGIRRSGTAEVILETRDTTFSAEAVVNCGGLHSDRLTRLSGQTAEARIVPFRGEYYELKPDARHMCRNLIYPVPDPQFPFLGVHFTRMIEGGVECGPNAVLAFAREGYRKRDINLRDFAETLSYPGFIKVGVRHWRMGAGEMWRSFSKAAFVRALQRLMPEIRAEHLVPHRAGVRAQAVGRDGTILDDFLIQHTDRIVNVGNAPSPAATSALHIGQTVVDRLAACLG
jgi:L-2-hydroxyglutarate oxidase